MNKTKVLFEGYDELTGITMVTIVNKYGRYKGFAVVSDEDRNHASKVTGCKIAEMHAYQNFFKDRIKQLQQQKQGIKRLAYMLLQTKVIRQSLSYPIIRKQCKKMIEVIDNEIAQWQRKINSSQNYIKMNY